MTRHVLFIALLIQTLGLKAQDSIAYPKGIYTSIAQLAEKSPSADYSIYMRNSRKMILKNKELSKDFIKDSIVAYSDGEELFINTYKFGGKNVFYRTLFQNEIIPFIATNKWKELGVYITGLVGASTGYLISRDITTSAFVGAGAVGLYALLIRQNDTYIIDLTVQRIDKVYPALVKDILSMKDQELYEYYRSRSKRKQKSFRLQYDILKAIGTK